MARRLFAFHNSTSAGYEFRGDVDLYDQGPGIIEHFEAAAEVALSPPAVSGAGDGWKLVQRAMIEWDMRDRFPSGLNGDHWSRSVQMLMDDPRQQDKAKSVYAALSASPVPAVDGGGA